MTTVTKSGVVIVEPARAIKLLHENGTMAAVQKYMKVQKQTSEGNIKMKFEIYSKENCIYCTKIKDLLTFHGITYEEKSLSAGYTKEDIQARVEGDKKINTVPQVFVNNEYLGGYLEVVEFIAYDKHSGINVIA